MTKMGQQHTLFIVSCCMAMTRALLQRYIEKFILFFVLIGMFSCDNVTQSDNDTQTVVTEADVFLASEKYQKYSVVMEADARMMRNAFKTLTKEEKQEYFRLLRSITDSISEEEYKQIVEEIYALTRIDIDTRLKKLSAARHTLLDGTHFTKKELLDAMQRRNVANSTLSITRATSEENRETCRHACLADYTSAVKECKDAYESDYRGTAYDESMNNKDASLDGQFRNYKDWCASRACEAIAANEYDNCLSECLVL